MSLGYIVSVNVSSRSAGKNRIMVETSSGNVILLMDFGISDSANKQLCQYATLLIRKVKSGMYIPMLCKLAQSDGCEDLFPIHEVHAVIGWRGMD